MNKEFNIESDSSGTDRVEGIEDYGEEIVLNYLTRNKKTGEPQMQKINVGKKVLDFVEEYIEELNVGEKTSIIELADAFVNHFKIKSKIVSKRIPCVREALEKNGFDSIRISYVMSDLENNYQFRKMDWEEIIGTRNTKNSIYFKLWASLRKYKQDGKINYLKSGNFWREI